MKKNLVIIAGTCYPIPSANGALALKCAKYLKNEYDISVISIRKCETKLPDSVVCDDIKIHTLGRFRLDWWYKHKKIAFESKGLKKHIFKASAFLARLCGKIDSTFFHVDNMWWYKKSAFKLLEGLNKERKIDAIISFCLPIESHLAALQYKSRHNDVLWASYWADDFAVKSNKRNFFISFDRLKQIESEVLNKSDVVFSTEELTEALKAYLGSSESKLCPIPYIINSSVLHKTYAPKVNERLTCIFMGNFYRKIRNPEYMLKVFSDSQLNNIKLLMYIGGDCNSIVEKYALNSSNIEFHGFIPKEQLEAVVAESDILINIDNYNCSGKPSKLFELISYRKPILNFGYSDDLGELENYPCKLQISMNESVHTAAAKIREFVSYALSFDAVTPEQIESVYEKHTENFVKSLITGRLINSDNKQRNYES